jgi:hypothetical protein
MSKFSFETFTNLVKTKGVARAEEYRDECNGIKKEEAKVEVSPVAEVLQTQEIEISRDGMKELLDNADIKYKGNISNAKMLELIKENGLI